MNKYLRKIVVLTLVSVMVLGLSVNAFATGETKQNTNSSLTVPDTNATPKTSKVTEDTYSINLIKDYVLAGSTENTILSPNELFEFTITPYGVWNAGEKQLGEPYAVTSSTTEGVTTITSNIPMLGSGADAPQAVITVSSAEGAAKADGTDTDTGAPLKTAVAIPTYNSIGDFWYKVVETNKQTTGVIYTTNDTVAEDGNSTANENHGHLLTYYIHVQVVNDPDYDITSDAETNQPMHPNKFFRSVTLHKEAPNVTSGDNPGYNSWVGNDTNKNYTQSVKVNNVQNKYYAGELEITKEVKGNAGDKDHLFPVTVTFTKAEGTIVESAITFNAIMDATTAEAANYFISGQTATHTGSETDSNVKWTLTNSENEKSAATATVNLYVKDGSTVTFSNIPYGISYTIKEQLPENDTYTQKMTAVSPVDGNGLKFDKNALVQDENKCSNASERNSDAGMDGYRELAAGSISDAKDEWKITNEKNVAIDVGVVTENAPYVALLAVAFAAVVVYGTRRKNMIEE